MNPARVLYHMAKADFLERVRRYSFLLTLGFAGLLASGVYRGDIVLILGKYRGAPNSAWFGAFLAIVATTFLSIVGFYIVKNSIERDEQTHVGRILAATPLGRFAYTGGKTISNFVVLASMVVVLGVGAALLQRVQGREAIEWWKLISPFLLIALPAMATVAALAVLAETIPGLRGGLGNVAYFFFWNVLVLTAFTRPALDFTGLGLYMGSMRDVLRQIDPSYTNSFALHIGPDKTITREFQYNGLHWSGVVVMERLLWVAIAFAIASAAAKLFHRFDPAKESQKRKKDEVAVSDAVSQTRAETVPTNQLHLTPLAGAATGSGSLTALVKAELRLMMKGVSKWWYLVALALWIVSIATPLVVSRNMLAAIWIWPLLLWSKMATRESLHQTSALIFSSARSLERQFPAMWLAGVMVALVTGSGVALRLLMAADASGLAAWLAGALFIPTLALALGAWSGTSKAFEAIYTAWWYAGPGNHIPFIDFMGTTARSSQPLPYFLLSATLLLIAFAGRRVKMAYA
jgi:hypothetical protein